MKVFAFLTILVTISPIVVAQQTQPVDPEQERLKELAQLESEAASLPQVHADSIQQVVKFSIAQDMITARTSLGGRDQQEMHVLGVPGLKGIVRLRRYDLAGAPGGAAPADADDNAGRNFQLMVQDLTDAKTGEVVTMVSAVGGRLIVSRDSERWSIQLIQDPPPLPGQQADEDPVRLLVQHRVDADKPNAPDNAEKQIDVKLSARSFVELRRQHEREMNQYLRPIIRDLGQEAEVFGVSAPMAWQVLGANYRPDQQVQSRVQAIVKRLDADDFRAREQALEDLRKLGQPAAIVLSNMDRTGLTPQQSSSVETFLADFAPLGHGQSQELADDKSFLLDVLYNDDPELRKLALKRLSKLTGRSIQLVAANDNDPRARSQAIDELRDELIGPPVAPATAPASSQPK